jgi:hypothetical protein
MVSIKARVKNPRVTKNSAKYPVRELCPKENNRIIAQATTGILRNKEAMPLINILKNPFIRVVWEPNNAKNVAKAAATVVDATDKKTVSFNFVKILGIFSKESALG